MAKRTPKSKPASIPTTTDGTAPAEPPRKVRSGGRAPRRRDVAAEMAGGQDQAAGMSDQFVGSPNTGEEVVQGQPPMSTESISMSSEPSAEDIRMRAYHRYLERGGGHGMEFEDWLEAERDLKSRR
jgi:hypothetical protein